MHSNSKSEAYAKAGVDITAGYRAVELMKAHVARTVISNKSSDIGGFGGLFELDITDMPHPVLVKLISQMVELSPKTQLFHYLERYIFCRNIVG